MSRYLHTYQPGGCSCRCKVHFGTGTVVGMPSCGQHRTKSYLFARDRYPTHARASDLRLDYIVAVVVVHVIAAAAPWTFRFPGLVAFVTLFFLTGPVGINLGFHRLLSHRSFRVHSNIARCFALLGTLALQGGPISWVGNHRYHHKEADRVLDPHTPLAGFAWAHFTWAFHVHPELPDVEHKTRFARDLAKDPFLRICQRYFLALNLLQVVILAGAGWLAGGAGLSLSMLVWGFALRVVMTWHMTFIVNSVNHLWGYRNYETTDNSRNNVWISILVFGEGWHNNHHADPRSASHGHRRFEFDMGYALIRIMEVLGIAKRVIRPRCDADDAGVARSDRPTHFNTPESDNEEAPVAIDRRAEPFPENVQC